MKKVMQIILICLMIIGIIVISTVGFNVGIKYSENMQINIYIGTEFNVLDIKKIAKEVFNNKKVLVQQVELYKDMVQITVKNATEDEINNLNNKINEKYNIGNNREDLTVTNNPNIRLRNIIKPYIMPIALVSILTIVSVMIVYRKLGIWKILYETTITIVGFQAILSSLYAVTRLPINRLTEVIAMIVYIVSLIIPMVHFSKIKNKLDEEKVNNK